MTSKLTRERIELIANFHRAMTLPPSHDEIEELARMAMVAMDSEPVAWDYEWASCITCEGPQDFKRVIEREAPPEWAVAEGQARNIIPLYRHAQQPVVDADDNFYSWFGREWQENYQHNQYTTAAKQMLGVMAESAWKAGRRAAMLQGAENAESRCGIQTAPALDSFKKNADARCGNSPVIPEGWQVEAEKLTEMHGMSFVLFRHGEAPQCADPTKVVISFTDKGLGHDMLPAAPQEEPDGK